MIGLGIPWAGTDEEAEIIAAMREGADLGKILRRHGWTADRAWKLYQRYVEAAVDDLKDRATAEQLRFIQRDCILVIAGKFFPAAAASNKAAAQMVIQALSTYSRLEREHYDLDQRMMHDQGATSADTLKNTPAQQAERLLAELGASGQVPERLLRARELVNAEDDDQ